MDSIDSQNPPPEDANVYYPPLPIPIILGGARVNPLVTVLLLPFTLSGDHNPNAIKSESNENESESKSDKEGERSVSDKWKDYNKNPGDWKKIDSKNDPSQPKSGKSERELWENVKTGEKLGVHRKTPTSKTKSGKPKHPHPFDPSKY